MPMRNWYQSPEDSGRDENREKPPRGKLPGNRIPGYRIPGYRTPGYRIPGYRVQVDRRQLLAGGAGLCALALLLAVVLTPAPTAELPSPATQAGAGNSITLAEDCVLLQHMVFSPCGHEITRREALPSELRGKTRADLESWFTEWRVTTFASDEVAMEQALDMYCPEHLVLMPDESGMLCIWQNTYGDALSLRKELNIPVSGFPEETQNQLRAGLGFDTEQALMAYLESAES